MQSKGEGRAKREAGRERRVAGRLPRVSNYNSQMTGEGKWILTGLGNQNCLMNKQKNGSTALRIIDSHQ